MEKGKIVVVMGGPSSEAEVSRKSGKAILDALKSKGHNVKGLEFVPKTFCEDIQKENCAIVFNAMHGQFGEDGILQANLNLLGIPCTGSGILASAITFDKAAAKRIFYAENISTPRSVTYKKYEQQRNIAAEIRRDFSLPVVVKAATQGSSIGVVIVQENDKLEDAITEAFSFSDEVVVEEFISGKELTVAVAGNIEKAEAFPIIEITTVSGRYDYKSKYTAGASKHIIPARISAETTHKVKKLAEKTFLACGCAGIARIDIMLSENNEPYVIEVNSVPGMTEFSLVPDAARAAGVEFPELCEKILMMAGYPV